LNQWSREQSGGNKYGIERREINAEEEEEKRQMQSQRKPRRGSRDCAEPKGPASSTQRLLK